MLSSLPRFSDAAAIFCVSATSRARCWLSSASAAMCSADRGTAAKTSSTLLIMCDFRKNRNMRINLARAFSHPVTLELGKLLEGLQHRLLNRVRVVRVPFRQHPPVDQGA